MTPKGIRTVLGRLEKSLRGQLRGIVRRGVAKVVSPTGGLQTLQTATIGDQVRDDVEYFEPHGFTSSPPAGSEGIVLRVGGDSSHEVGLAFHKRGLRPSAIEAGEVCVYHESGSQIVLRTDGSIEVHPAAGQTVNLGGNGGPAVARANDPIALNATDIAALAALYEYVFGDTGSPLVSSPPPPGTATPTGLGTITAGGTGSTST